MATSHPHVLPTKTKLISHQTPPVVLFSIQARSPPRPWLPTFFSFLLTSDQDPNPQPPFCISLTLFSPIPCPPQKDPSLHPTLKPHQLPFPFPCLLHLPWPKPWVFLHPSAENHLVCSCSFTGSDVTAMNITEKLSREAIYRDQTSDLMTGNHFKC